MYNIIPEGFGECALSYAQVLEWCAEFKAGRTELGDDEQTGRPMSSTPETITKIQQRIREDRCQTIHDIVTMF